MSLLDVRMVVVQVEETSHEAGRQVEPPTRKVVAAAVVANPPNEILVCPALGVGGRPLHRVEPPG